MSGETEVERSGKTGFLWYKVLKHGCLLGIWLSMGLLLEVVGPTIPDLKAKIGLDYEEISRALIGTSVGYFFGSLLGGVLHERFYRITDVLMSLAVLLGAVAMFAMPWSESLLSLALVFCCIGVSVALSNAGGNAMVLHLWGEGSGPPMYMLHFCFGLGGLSAPQIVRPFLSPSQSESSMERNNATPPSGTNISDTAQEYLENSTSPTEGNLFVPYTIIGGINLFFSLCMLTLFLCGPPKGFPRRAGTQSIRKLFSPRSCMAGGRSLYSVLLLALLFLYYFQAVGGENVYGKWIFSYALETEVGFTKDQAAMLTSVFWFSHVAGRGMGIILSKFLPIRVIILADILGLIITSTVLAIFGHQNTMVLWILTAFMGFLVSPLFPAGLLWANHYLTMSSMTVMVCILGGSTGHLCYVYLSGYMFEYIGPQSMMFVEIFYAVMMLAIFVLLEVFGRLSLKKGGNQVTAREEGRTEGTPSEDAGVLMMQNLEKL